MTLPRIELWTDIHCPACKPCGWYQARLLFKIEGTMVPSDALLHVKCSRCQSIIGWRIGTAFVSVVSEGPKQIR